MSTTTQEIKPNQKQLECIENINGKYLVLAGPGTGKTFTIIKRIKNMIEKNVKPERILCLTFTDAAASEMKKRIEKEMNVISSDIAIYTYHSFCSDIISDNLDKFELPNNFKIVSDAISKALIKECIDEIKPKYFRTEKNDPYFYINTIKNRISSIKQNRLTKEKYFKNLKENPDWEPDIKKWEEIILDVEKGLNKRYKNPPYSKRDDAIKRVEQARELWEFYELYQNKLFNQKYLDFNDMINLVLDKFEADSSFLEDIANKFDYLLVDEYQDTNKSQNDIVFYLAQNLDNIFVVGDDNQIIYRFQGAKLDTIEKFLDKFPDTKVICLEENMRSTQNILDCARLVVSGDPLSLENNPKFINYNINKKLNAKNEKLFLKNKPVRFYKYTDKLQEQTEIVMEIDSLINSCDRPEKLSEIAILTKTNSEAIEYAQLLKLKNIPYELKEGKDIFEIPSVNVLYMYIKALINPDYYCDRLFKYLLAKPFSINSKDYILIQENKSKCKNIIDAIKQIPLNDYVESEKIKEFIDVFEYLSNFKQKENIKNTILEIGSKTGIFNYYLNEKTNRSENIAGLKKFVDFASDYSQIYKTTLIDEYIDYLDILFEDDEKIKTDKAPVALNAVQVLTYHGSKGREFEYVYMPSLNQYNWESSKSQKDDIPLDISEYKTDDEIKEMKYSDLIKLLYVGMTRAKHSLRLSYSQNVDAKPRKLTKFISDIQDKYDFETEKTPFEYNENSYWNQVCNLLDKRDYDYVSEFNKLIDSKINGYTYSATSVNQYLKCPRQFLYDRILALQGMDGNPNALSYGSAVHSAFEKAINYAIENKHYPSKDDFINYFKKSLSSLAMESYEQREIFEQRGEKMLDEYYAILINTPISKLYGAEYRIRDDRNILKGIKFTGSIDRIDKNDDGTYIIYDYKTGNNKNSSIKLDGEHEDYYNQIAFYKYYFEKMTGNKVESVQFIYPEDYKTKNEGFKLTDDECISAIQKIKDSVDAINRYEFEPKYNKNSCRYCEYRNFCQMEII